MGTPSCSSLPAAVWVGQRGCCRLMQLPSPQKDSAPQPKQRGNYKKPKLLYCSNGGHFLRILPDGTVDGTRDRSDQHIQLQLSAESVGEVYIKSTETGQYLAMDTDGLLYGSQTPNEECLFLERLEENHYNTYTSKKHAEKNWFVGLKKNGSCKRGPRTHYGQKAILFLPLPVSSD
uniref:Multifunctional fusion protein n=1 Tax=Equus caballus TaxID=9796 RepID=A0A9L0TC84_HORSE